MIRRLLNPTFTALCVLAGSLVSASVAHAQATLTSINTVIGGALTNPSVVTAEGAYVDVYGNIFVLNTSGTSVTELPANGGAPITVATGLVSARGVAADSKGNVFIAQSNVATILKIPAGGGPNTTMGTVGRPFLMMVDSADTLYVVDSNFARIAKFASGSTTQVNVAVTPIAGASIHAVALDASGNLYVTALSTDPTIFPVTRIAPDGTNTSLPITGISSVYGIAIDAAGSLYLSEGGGGRLLKYATTNTNTFTTLATALGAVPQSVVLSPRGDVIYNNSKLFAYQTGGVNFYGVPVLSTSGNATLTFTLATGKTMGAPIFTSNGSATPLFKDAGAEVTGCTAGKAIAAGGTCTLNISFTPQQAGLATGTVTIMDNSTPGVPLFTVPLSGIGTAPVPAFGPGTQSIFLSSLGQPAGVALDGGGNVYVADLQNATVTKTVGGVSSTLGFTGLSRPTGVTVDNAGAVYVSDASNNAIYKLTAAGVQTTVATTGLSAPKGIALDNLGNLYIADSGNARVVRVSTTSVQTTVALTGLAAPAWVALDNAANLYVADTGSIYELTVNGTQKTLATPGLTAPIGIAAGADGSIYAADGGHGNVFVLEPSGASFTLASTLGTPAGLALAANGSLYVANSAGGQVLLLDRTKQTLAFPSTAVTATSAAMTATVQNVGNATLTDSSFNVSAGFAQVTPTAATDCTATSTVISGAICNVNITFAPAAVGPATGTATLTDNALNAAAATQTIQLTGTGIRATTSTIAQTTPATGNPVYGQTPTVTVTVAPTTGTGTPTGTATFVLDGGAPTAPVALTNGTAVFSPTGLTAGTHTVTASYSGDTAFAASTASSFTITVTPAVLNVTATAQTRMYNVANATLAYTITGFAYSETASVVSGVPVLTTTATTTSAPGSYPITVAAGTLSSPNYTFNLVNSTITVTKANSAITFPAISNVTYGVSPITLTASADSGLAVTYSVVSGPATVTNGAGAAVTITGAGTVKLAANQAGDTNYSAATQATQTFVVSPAVLTVTADSLSKQAGQANPALTYTFAGFKYTDTSAVLSGAPNVSTTATTGSPTGSYTITILQGTLAAANYTFAFVNGTLTVTGSTAQTITFGTLAGQTYGVAPITLTGTSSSGLPLSYTVAGPATLSGNVLTITGIGRVTINATQAGNATYAAATPISQSFTVAPAVLTVTTANASKTINTPNPTFTYTITGFVNGESTAVVSGAPALTTTATTNSLVGPYPISAAVGTLTASNYTFTLVGATLTVNPAPQTITFATLPNVTYGVTPITLTATTTSPLAVTYAVTGPATLSGSTVTITGVGSVTVTASQAGDATYAAATPVVRSFTVAPAPLTVTASDTSIVFGAAIPTTFAYTITGFQYADTQSVVTGTPVITTSATASSAAGPYPITPVVGTLKATNYTFGPFVPGTLTIGISPQTITFPTLPATIAQTATETLTATSSSGLPITYTVATGAPAAVSGTNVVTFTNGGTVSITASQPGNGNFLPAPPVTQTFFVTATSTSTLVLSTNTANLGASVTLTATIAARNGNPITGATTQPKPTGTVTFYQGTTLIATTQGVSAATVNSSGVATLSVTTLPGGSLGITAVYSGDANFSPSTSASSPILIIASDFNVTASTTNLTIAQGDSGTTTITVTPLGGYSQTIGFSCSSLPANMTCSFAPPAMNFYPGTGTATQPQSTVLTISTTAASAHITAPSMKGNSRGQIAFAGLLLGVPFLFVLPAVRRTRKSLGMVILFLVGTGAALSLSGCGGSVTTLAQKGSNNIQVNFNDGSAVVHVLTVTVTVQ